MTAQLRPWTHDDAAALSNVYSANSDLRVQFSDVDLSDLESAHDYIEEHLSSTSSSRNWAVVVDGAVVGNVGLSAIERRHGTGWAHYWLAGEARGYGYASRALATVAAHAFVDGLFRLELGHRVNNPASCKVAANTGFAPEGLQRQKLQYGAERFDVETHARLRSDPDPNLKLLHIAR